ncbi:MAG: hypothetical protein A3B74_04825 [Candidatus Kerfeldbacteria bacterium RIFCSPHIGHO2_02_FULL_42_14]|uniref:ABC transporter domain-containing protein n=1 Tax=Candidatus Kerfeldbacteria bacterium RIFCSPHIGHO2_02_FULL_42_14 TaxID=1798540 RepID=A0A1G2AP39_9BACT|nr:MAG: hypothetical protein A3B74_04825 [Candidatus Kerfeldbacteria bacterium RIFCSPHIGHO2_02_FULL_42_14]OGY81044.1 MAG: hypothetical protein A3E60_03545 [Candidatus Kerfeldbacteria bacterium RIFCSPHIGHO2_12_FULL_42_13]OGY84862.1 MAG: hypothetical protein A3I91_05190 [Candidatus Kerfeldbacteria bacterium RIFCSPLOWO2_02_FULL_42_19]OGY86775.1 MAG: hypothetical protein A3G01_02490 [Candidatus Kerfeldbacteria bacterium RIFCSPLOWO2_12_FULL_43_9]
MIEVQELTKIFDNIPVLDHISFHLKDGEILGFLGPNGAGKTTTMRILTGFLAPTTGTIRINNKDLLENGRDIRQEIGYLPENNPLYTDMRVYEALHFIAQSRNIADDALEMKRVVKVCALQDVIAKPIQELSKGFKQRVGLAQALIGDPRILILDEPTSGLDPNQAREVRELIRTIAAKKTIIFSTHILQEATNLCHRAIIIHKGKIVAQGTPRELARLGSGKEELRMIIEGPEANVAKVLENLAHVTAVRLEHAPSGEPLFIVQTEEHHDLRREIFRLVKENHWVLLELTRAHADLETVFQALTRSSL